jgi:hypothetical protein
MTVVGLGWWRVQTPARFRRVDLEPLGVRGGRERYPADDFNVWATRSRPVDCV